jgi:hypothetical protein
LRQRLERDKRREERPKDDEERNGHARVEAARAWEVA